MGLYEVLLGVDRAARDTGNRMTMQVRETDPLSAAIKAERKADAKLNDPRTMYTHAMRVRAIHRRARIMPMPRPASRVMAA